MKQDIVGYAIVYDAHDYQFVQGPNERETRLNYLHECLDTDTPKIALYATKKAARAAINKTHAYSTAFCENHEDERKFYKIVPVIKRGDWS